ncbi:MAG: hypothetical protein JSS02_24515 [Planctomycetes bacterium]|nr:hypothetical protein [Planctomycetota bacterium]
MRDLLHVHRLAAFRILAATGLFALLLSTIRAEEPTSIRALAAVDLTFDEPGGTALDTAQAGAGPDSARFLNGAGRVRSTFPGQTGKWAVSLDAATRQYLEIPDSRDLDRPDAVTFALFFVNLQPTNDPGYRGILAKRDDARQITNYGINFSQTGDLLQVYLNTGSGYKSAVYSLNGTIGRRRPVFITASFQVGDAPAPDQDGKPDDLRIRFYVNGQPVKPKSVSGGIVVDNDAWLTDIQGTQLLNDVPLILGASSAAIEHTSCQIDEFLLFTQALSSADVARLYAEVAGPPAASAAPEDQKPVAAGPEITSLSLQGLTRGQPTMITVTGTNLLPDPVVVTTAPLEKQGVRPGATAEHVEFEITASLQAPAGHYPLQIQTVRGLSHPLPIAIDSLPQTPFAESSPEKPVVLPVAISGTLSGQQQARVFFAGKAGQRVVIDLECRRLGATMDPVLELRNPRGAPLTIAWGRPQLRGDTRIEAHLFMDGIYSLELHDLAFKAPPQSVYRLKIGDLKLVDTTFPAGVSATQARNVAAIGPGLDETAVLHVNMQQRAPGMIQPIYLAADSGSVGPAPAVISSGATEILEQPTPAGQKQVVDATFAESSPVVINGRIALAGEIDTYQLTVTPGSTLNFQAESYSFHSPLEAHLEVRSHPQGALLARSEDKPVLEFAVPPGVTAVQLAVRDLNRRGGADFVYRLRMIPAGFADFSLAVATDRLVLPHGGTAVIRVDATRTAYDGPIHLSLSSPRQLSISPTEIPAGASKAFVLLRDSGPKPTQALSSTRVQLQGRSSPVDLRPARWHAAQIPFDSRLALLPELRTELTCLLTSATTASLELGKLPDAWFRGVDIDLPVSVKSTSPELNRHAMRLSLLTTEAVRNIVDPTDPTQQRRIAPPLLHSLPEQWFLPGETGGAIRITVPPEVAESQIDAVIRADFASQPFSENVVTSIYSNPFRLPVQNAVTVQFATPELKLTGNANTTFRGTVKRAPSWTGAVSITLLNLPTGYTSAPVTVPPDQDQFELVIASPAITAAAKLANVQIRVATPLGNLLQVDTPVAVSVAPET